MSGKLIGKVPQEKIWKNDPSRDYIINEILNEIGTNSVVNIIKFLKRRSPTYEVLTKKDRYDIQKKYGRRI